MISLNSLMIVSGSLREGAVARRRLREKTGAEPQICCCVSDFFHQLPASEMVKACGVSALLLRRCLHAPSVSFADSSLPEGARDTKTRFFALTVPLIEDQTNDINETNVMG